MTQTDQSFFQAVDAKFNIRDVLVGPFDLKTCTFKKCAHAESLAERRWLLTYVIAGFLCY
jgi:hypothetical protein